MEKCEVILGLGSNVGNRRAQLGAAVAGLAEYVGDMRVSSIYESAALLPEGAPPEWNMNFYNMAVAGMANLSPRELLKAVKQIEKNLGRNKTGHWSPREIDIDILAMGNLIVNEPDLSIPHPELLKRDFALVPLAEIAPGWVHPLAGKTAKDLCRPFAASGLKLLKKPVLLGIANITPDSFSDGGVNFNPEIALANIQALPGQGADIVDIGAESTRPGAKPLSQAEEWARLEPVLGNLKGFPVPISVDTRYAQTAKKALALGAGWINDVSGFANADMVAAVRDSDSKLVVMHSLSVPADKNIILPVDADPVEQLLIWAEKRFSELEKSGIDRARLIFDPGIGFGKNAEQSHAIIKGISRFRELGVPLLVGHSRKSFLGQENPEDATIKISQFLADSGVDYLRVHNVRRHRLEVL